MLDIKERVAKLEVEMETLDAAVRHIDFCLDSLKRTVWTAAGALAALAVVIQIVVQFFMRQ